MRRSLLVVLLHGATRAELEAAVEQADEGEGVSVYVVGPTTIGPLDWLATDERRAHGEAASRVLEAEWLLAESDELGGEVGDRDPVLAAEDALRQFDADEIALVGTGTVDRQLLAALGELGRPVHLLGLTPGADTVASRVRAAGRGLISGRSAATPFVAFVAANLGLLLLAVVLSVLAGLIVWLIETVG